MSPVRTILAAAIALAVVACTETPVAVETDLELQLENDELRDWLALLQVVAAFPGVQGTDHRETDTLEYQNRIYYRQRYSGGVNYSSSDETHYLKILGVPPRSGGLPYKSRSTFGCLVK